jgi:hypothetical protein
MRGGALNKGTVFLPVALLVALLFAAGCGSSGNSEITVQTGSLSKAAFIKKADAICEAARTEFLAKYTKFLEAKTKIVNSEDQQAKEVLLSEILESLLAPNIEGQITKISNLGAPSSYAPEVADFLNALQNRMEKAEDDPRGFTTTPTPFVRAENIARKAAMNGCAESFS